MEWSLTRTSCLSVSEFCVAVNTHIARVTHACKKTEQTKEAHTSQSTIAFSIQYIHNSPNVLTNINTLTCAIPNVVVRVSDGAVKSRIANMTME